MSERLRAAVQSFLRPDFFFVNIGANDGVTNDPIYPFVKEYGWAGIVVEPADLAFEQLQANYEAFSGIIFEQAAIAATPRPFHYLPPTPDCQQGWTEQVGSLNRAYLLKTIFLMRHFGFQGPVPDDLEGLVLSRQVPCLTFEELLRKHGVERVDFLNIDAEGADFEIFSSIDLRHYRPSILCIEVSEMSASEKLVVDARLAEVQYTFLEPFDLYSSVYVQPPPG